MIVQVDTSALAKLLVEEEGSADLRKFLAHRAASGDEFAISTIAVTELRRLAIRLDVDSGRIESVVRPFRVIRLTEGILELAGRLQHKHLGTLDAIHIATALTVEAPALLTYDAQQADAAHSEGLTQLSPGILD